MKFITVSTLFAILAVCQAQLLNQTAPFNLQLKTCNTSDPLNGQYLTPCHEGAAIEALCLAGDNAPKGEFRFNYSSNFGDDSNNGYVTWLLKASNVNFSEPLRLSYDPTTNVAVPLFFPDDQGQLMGFNKNEYLFIQGGDDRTNPRNLSTIVQYRRWSICETYVGYQYETLSWTLGESQPENPTCRKVEVQRVFV